jgi:hypothetical protein
MNQSLLFIPRRLAKEQFTIAAANACLLRIREDGLYEVDGVGGRCLMEKEEYEAYKALCAAWAAAGSDQPDSEPQGKPRSYFAASFREIEQLLLSYSHILCEEERDDLILNLAAKVMPLKEAVLRAEEIWNEGRTQP